MTQTIDRRNEELFSRLEAETRRKAISLAMTLTRNRDEAEDIVQSALANAWRGFESFDRSRSFQSWLLRIVQRKFIEKRRLSEYKYNWYVLGDNPETAEIDVQDPGPSPENLMEESWQGEVIREAIDRLPKLFSEPIQMVDLEGLSYPEVSDRLGIPISTIRSRLHRGRKLLRELVRDELEEAA